MPWHAIAWPRLGHETFLDRVKHSLAMPCACRHPFAVASGFKSPFTAFGEQKQQAASTNAEQALAMLGPIVCLWVKEMLYCINDAK
jgi:hypothetical protein